MDAKTALTQIAELVDDVQAEYPEVASSIQDAVNEARSMPKAEDQGMPPEEEGMPPEMPKDFKSASKAAMQDGGPFGGNKDSSDSESEEDEDEDDKKKRDKAKAF